MIQLFRAILQLTYIALFNNINNLHAWCTPGGAIAFLVSKLSGKPMILDSFEPHAESMVEGGTWKKNGLAYRILFRLEKLQLKRAKEVICAAEGMATHSETIYGVKKTRYFVKPACVDLQLFDPEKYKDLPTDLPLKNKVCFYAGKFGGIYLEKEVFDFFKVAYDYWKGDFTVLLLTNHSDEEIKQYCNLSGLPFEAVVKKFVPYEKVASYMRLGHFAICPVKPMSSKLFCSPIKNGEYWAMGLPVVITKEISNDSKIIEKNQIGYVLQSLTSHEYIKAAKQIEYLLQNEKLGHHIRMIAQKERNYNIAEAVYQTIYA